MSRHLVSCAADLQLEPLRLKLAMIGFAESARDKDRIALPGPDALQRWTNVKRSQVYNLISDLIELQLIARHKPAHRGQRAEYLVFPLGCCEVHGKRPAMVVEDGAVVVSIDGDLSGPSRGVSMTFSTASDDDAGSLDPLPGERVQSAARKGPIRGEKGSNLPFVMGPVTTLDSGRLQDHSCSNHSTEPQPLHSGTDRQQLQPRATDPLDEIEVDARLAKAAALRAGGDSCPHCDGGWLHDRAGLPTAPCLACTAGRRAALLPTTDQETA